MFTIITMGKHKKIFKYILQTINLNPHFNLKTKNRKYTYKQLLKYIIHILKQGLSFRSINDLYAEYKNIPNWNTIYKFYNKLIKYQIIETTYKITVNKYLNKTKNEKNKIFITDTTFILNKYGIDKVGYNHQIPKHKLTKISIITDIKGKPINTNIYNGSINDAKILDMQLSELPKDIPIFNSNNNILLADAAYDSNNLQSRIKNLNFGKLITPKNKRNCKNIKLIIKNKLTNENKKLLKNRINVEHTFSKLKQYKRLSMRYDKYSINYLNFVYLACIDIIIK